MSAGALVFGVHVVVHIDTVEVWSWEGDYRVDGEKTEQQSRQMYELLAGYWFVEIIGVV